MKFGTNVLRWCGSVAGASLLRAWVGTLRSEFTYEDPRYSPFLEVGRRPALYAVWHESLFAMLPWLGRRRLHTLVSQSSDGNMIASAMSRLGWRVIRGSSSRGGAQALRELITKAESDDAFQLGITCDGPRGPRRLLKPGLIYLASQTGVPIIPTGIGYDRPWEARSWDRFKVPRPFTKVTIHCAEPLAVPNRLDATGLEAFRQRVESALLRAQLIAEGRHDESASRRAA